MTTDNHSSIWHDKQKFTYSVGAWKCDSQDWKRTYGVLKMVLKSPWVSILKGSSDLDDLGVPP